MATRKTTETLGYLGEEVQYQIVKALIEDREYFKQIYSMLNQNAFTVQYLKQMTGLMKDMWKKEEIHPTYNDLEIRLIEKAKTDIEVEEAKGVIAKLKKDSLLDGMTTAKEVAIRFFAQQETIKVLQKGIESLGKDGYVEGKTIRDIYEGLSNIGKIVDEDKGSSPLDLFEDIMSSSAVERVSTGVSEIDRAMNGGLPKQSIGLLIAKTGAGKTSLGTIFCAGAAKAGYKVVQIFFEESVNDIAAKHYAYHTGRYTKEFNDTAEKAIVWNELKKDPAIYEALKHNTIIKRMNNGSTTVEDIRDYLKHLIASGFKPDMVFIDYFSCIQTSADRRIMYGNEVKAGEMAMKKIEQMANDLDIAIWVAEQTNRMALKKVTDFERIGNIQGNYRITQPASFIFNLERAEGRSDYNSANLYMDKCRGCEPHEWLNFKLNNGNVQIDMSTMESRDSLEWEPDESDNNNFKTIIFEDGKFRRN